MNACSRLVYAPRPLLLFSDYYDYDWCLQHFLLFCFVLFFSLFCLTLFFHSLFSFVVVFMRGNELRLPFLLLILDIFLIDFYSHIFICIGIIIVIINVIAIISFCIVLC
eukprot:GCRY01006068.1.p1 GENE.GCRY01006068.1~~GCRY01006068.1.p1  ORF type:complete len:109 (+),score=2.09 GCRY01006068.1:139-465(+)